MDLIYTDVQHNDVGVMKDYTFDLAFGSDENDFELTIDLSKHCCDTDCLIYIEGTEYGGVIDGYSVTTKDDKLAYKGRTWQGVLASCPTTAATWTGEANALIGDLLSTYDLLTILTPSSEGSGIFVDGYDVDTELDLYQNIMAMLGAVGGKLKFSFLDHKVIVSVHPIVDYSKDEQFDNDTVEMEIEKTRDGVTVKLDLTADDAIYDVGDIIGAKEIVTDTVASEKITKKIITIKNGDVNIQYKVGE